ncbi:U3 small nucleolar RNA-associated protein 25 [Podosphaera aphanis]|nr:U3 small nucleolar RNA-associated protein 25 [Podosphaera aphanis]
MKGQYRGTSRGRGGFRGGRRKPTFDSARIALKEEKELNEKEESENSQQETSESEEEKNSDDEEILPTIKSYSMLLQSFAAEAPRQAKRRKITHSFSDQQTDDAVKTPGIASDKDEVEEPEEGPETSMEAPLDEEVDYLTDSKDPFVSHFADPDTNLVTQRIKSLEENRLKTQSLALPQHAKTVMSYPHDESSEVFKFEPISAPNELKLKPKLLATFLKQKPDLDMFEKNLASLIFNYLDVLFCERTHLNSEALRRLTCLHVVNHIYKTRDRVIKDNYKIAKEQTDEELELRDQGFTRPKALFLLPTRESCVRMVTMITSLCDPEQQENRKRFDDSYVDKSQVFSETKPDDFRELFGGNDDDMFRLGLKFTRKTIKFFSQFYNSDIIFASPLGLRMALNGKDNDKRVDYDFLSSIELVVVDQTDALLMQNWEHVEFIMEHLNLQPRETHGCDFSRVRNWYLENNAKYFCQKIVFAPFNTPDLNTMFFNHSKNWAGKVKVSAAYPGVLQELGLKPKQTFSRLESKSFETEPDERFTYFTSAIVPTLTRRIKDSQGTLIVIPSYLDFVRVRNYFSISQTTTNLSFGTISEYTSSQDVARARSHFSTGRHCVLLYTERAHHFRRYRIRGVHKVIMYSLPENPIFYKEIVGYLGRTAQEGQLAPGNGSVRVVFSRWDALKLERIVGTNRLRKMIMEKGDTFEFL